MLWFAVIPAVIVLIIGGLAYASGGGQRGKRYRPGRPYEVAPVWFLAAPESFDEARRDDAGRADEARGGVLAGKPQPPAISSGEVEAGRRAVPQGSTGGASDSW